MSSTGLTAILLAGGIRPSPLHQALTTPVLRLPLGDGRSLLDHWIEALGKVPEIESIRVVVSDRRDAEAIRPACREDERPDVEVVIEPARWRGTAGAVRDVAEHQGWESDILVAEGSCVPPRALQSLCDVAREARCSVVGVSSTNEPAGVFLIDAADIDVVPRIGFFDIKEQWLPLLHEAGHPARPLVVAERVRRCRDRADYLEAIAESLEGNGPNVAVGAEVSPSARLLGACLVGSRAVVEDGAFVCDSVLLAGSRVGRGAVVNGSVIGEGVTVEAGETVREQVMSSHPAKTGSADGRTGLASRGTEGK